MRYPLPIDFRIDLDELSVAARGFQRPECVLALSSGEVITSHGGGGYSVLAPSGCTRHVLGQGEAGREYVPNGIALAPDGRVLFADLGADYGGIFAIEPEGKISPLITEVEGRPIPPSNFVVVDEDETIWFTVSTRQYPRSVAWTPTVADGYIAVQDARGVRILADGLGYTNEIAFSPDRRWVYVNETYAQRVKRFPLLPGPALGAGEVVAQFTGADLPDGICFDELGGAWVSCIGSNRLLLIRPDGALQVILSDTDPAHAARVENGVRNHTLSHADMQTAGTSSLGNISSLAFGGPERRTVFLGCLLDDRIRSFQLPICGANTSHWHRRLAP
jgi:sugar lactone lactonase YvrE